MIWASSQARSECVLFLNILCKGLCKCDWESLNPGDMPLQNIIAIREWKANERKSRIAPLKQRNSSRCGVIFAGNIENDVSDKCEASDETRKVSSEPYLHKASPDMQFKRNDQISCGKEDFLCNDNKEDLSQSCGTYSTQGHGNPQSTLSQNNHPNKTSTKSKEEVVLDLSSLFDAYSTTRLKPPFGHLRDKSSNHISIQRDTPNESGRAQINSKHTPNMLPNMDQKRPFCNAIEILKPQKGLYEPSKPTFPGRALTSLKSNNIQTSHSTSNARASEKSNRNRQNFILDPKSGIYLGLMKENDQSQDILHTPLDSNLPGVVDDIIITENRDIGERDVRATHIRVLKSTNYEFFDSRNQYDLKEIMMVFDRPLDYGVNSIKDPIRSCSHISSLHLGDYGNHKNNSA